MADTNINSLSPTLTKQGIQALATLMRTGIKGKITHIGIGAGAYTPTDEITALVDERALAPVLSVSGMGAQAFSLEALFDPSADDGFWVSEIGLYFEDGTLLAVWSSPDEVRWFHGPGTQQIIQFMLILSALPADSIEVYGDLDLSILAGAGFAKMHQAITRNAITLVNNAFELHQQSQQIEDLMENSK
ncbi:hypothetical protein GCM10007094_23930 [Pseudovibrio japonicus]|uniref:Phage tail fibre protein N-terminal domain-containing protein n=1 Tax=Pseudovibrio japonicus TaxID=366534 RepID=A0ABQ3EET8_9HYPH|nr:phage tail protein [Pseudovibrio japonicus]GHB34090.1 hypothetical protein GCM10007094_23930 [Pseudovibrio japonicus]